jgi:hypothetical protein
MTLLALFLISCVVPQTTLVNPRNQESTAESIVVELSLYNSGDTLNIDLGDVRPTTEHIRTLSIQNVTNSQLQIANVVAACSCTAIDYDTRQVADPSDALRITLKFRAPSKPGKFRQQARLIGPISKDVAVVEVQGVVVPMVQLSAYEFRFASPGDSSEIVVVPTIDNLPIENLEVVAASDNVTLSRLPGSPDKNRVMFKVSAPKLFGDVSPSAESKAILSISAEVEGVKCSELIEVRLINESLLRVRPEVQFLRSRDESRVMRFVINSPPSATKEFMLKFESQSMEPSKVKHLSDSVSLVEFELPESVTRSDSIREGTMICNLAESSLESSVKVLFD